MKISEVRSYNEAIKGFKWEMLWDIFDGNKEWLNIAHECIDRHVSRGVAIRIKFSDGHIESYTFKEISSMSSCFANFLESRGIEKGDRVAVMLEPCLEFYIALFGTLKRGAVFVPLFTLFGPEAIKQRLFDSMPRLFITAKELIPKISLQQEGIELLTGGDEFFKEIDNQPDIYHPATSSGDLAVLQYTSGTTRQLPEAIRHTHRSCVTLMLAAIFGLGLRDGDSYFCPSSPAWGHGLWHGTISPLALGIPAGAYSGKFSEERFMEALEELSITNVAAAPTVFRKIMKSGVASSFRLRLEKLSYTGEPIDSETFSFLRDRFGVVPCSMYGTTEVGVIIANFPGFSDFVVKPGSLGKPVPGWEVGIIDEKGNLLPPGRVGEIAVKRKDGWFRVKDAGMMDEDGYFWHKGRSDDVIISAGWTISAVEIEDCLLRHPEVVEVAVIGVPDPDRGQIVKAFVKVRKEREGLSKELQEYVKKRLGMHEYPRAVEFIDEIPKTPAGKVYREALRERHKRLMGNG
jgi:acetyl-CoA synthetase